MAPLRRRTSGAAAAATGVLLLACGPRGASASANHDALQGREAMQMAWQGYAGVEASGRRLSEPAYTCEQVSTMPWEHMRIGYEFLDAEGIDQEILDHIGKNVLGRAIQYWSRALRVHQVAEPLRADYMGKNCEKYGLAFDGRVIAAESHYTCEAAEAPLCGPHGLRIPEKFLRAKRVCSKRCPNMIETFAHLLQASDGTCDNCTELPEGPGAVGYDFFVFVTIKDDFCEGDVQAHATTCVKDQCDRPIFGLINFCPAKISLEAEDTDRQVTTAVHELAHALAFSAHHFQYFRNPDGTPKMAREPDEPSLLKGAVPWSCQFTQAGTAYRFPDPEGDRRYIDLSESGIIGKFHERGLDSCPCPVGQKDMQPGCILPPQPSFRTPKCNFRLTTPMVKQKTQEFFGCPNLPGAELENQPTSPCVIISSHWEQRAFMGEVMVSAQVIQPTFLSEVTLALFHDSGWYLPDYGMADRLVRGVHWGYLQGCAFAIKPCVQDGKTEFPRFWCSEPGARSCSLDRRGEVQCSTSELPQGEFLPPTMQYSRKPLLGFVAEADYCPFFHVRITNHVCTDKSSTTFPISNVNFERESFGDGSRCLESTLYGSVETGDGVYRAEPDKFAVPEPRCYEVRCVGPGYEVWISSLNGTNVKLGTCYDGVQAITGLGLLGEVRCAPVEELCGLQRARHLEDVGSAPMGASQVTAMSHVQEKAEVLTEPMHWMSSEALGNAGQPRPHVQTVSLEPLVIGAALLMASSLAVMRHVRCPLKPGNRMLAPGWSPGIPDGKPDMRVQPRDSGDEGPAGSLE